MKSLNIREKILSIALMLFILLTFLRGCENRSIKVSVNKLTKKVDSLQATQISKKEIFKALTIEGLKAERRMIQSTDRKIYDLTRQIEIDKELKKLEQ